MNIIRVSNGLDPYQDGCSEGPTACKDNQQMTKFAACNKDIHLYERV